MAHRPAFAVGFDLWLVGCAALLGPIALSSCQANQDCERKRLEVFRAWESVHQAAYERKLAGVDEPKWTTIEAKTDLLQSAFATQQVTWSSADKTKDDLAVLVQDAKTDTDAKMELFRTSTSAAAAKQTAFAQACR